MCGAAQLVAGRCRRRRGRALGTHDRPDVGLPTAHQRTPQRQPRDRSRLRTAGRDLLAHAHPRAGLQLRASLADAAEAASNRALTDAERNRGRRHPMRVFAPRHQHELERELAAQAESAYKRLSADWAAKRPNQSGRRNGARIFKSAKGEKLARQNRAPSACPSAGGHPRSRRRIPPPKGRVQHLTFHPWLPG